MKRICLTILAAASLTAAFAGAAAAAGTLDLPGPGLPAGAPARMELSDDGPVLVTPAGMTLYLFSNEDTKAEKFQWRCTDKMRMTISDQQSGVGEIPLLGAEHQKSCTQKFPPYAAAEGAAPAGDFTVIDRPEGGRQWAYRGFPLYSSTKDSRPGDRNGVSVGGLFGNTGGGGRFGGPRLALQAFDLPMGMTFLHRDEGLVFAAEPGYAPVYTPKGGRPRGGEKGFKPLLAPAIATVQGDIGLVDAGSGRRQYAFRGQPLYLAPEDMANFEIAALGDWRPVVVSKSPGFPAAFGTRHTLQGEVYTTKEGRTLYTYACTAGGLAGGIGGTPVACDDAGDAAGYMVALCGSSAECARRWQPLRAPAGARPQGKWSVVDITYPMFTDPRGQLYPATAPRVRVWAYRGRPLFTYWEDKKPGDIWGEGVKGLWGSAFTVLRLPGRPELD